MSWIRHIGHTRDMLDLAAQFAVVARHRPVRLVVPDGAGSDLAGAVAPYVATQARRAGAGPAELALSSGGTSVVARFEPDAVILHVDVGGRTTTHRSRRHARPRSQVGAVALALTGPQVTALTWEGDEWLARSRFDLTERADADDPHDPRWLAGLRASASGPLDDVVSGCFGQLGLRDLRLVTEADGTPYREGDGTLLLTATSAGPGWFPTGHASVWALDPGSLALTHRADLFARRDGRVFGDHAVHLVRDRAGTDDGWLLAASTWGDFDRRRRPVRVVLAQVGPDVDPTRGVHVLDARPLALPTDGLRSVGVWDPHLLRADGPAGNGWLVGFVSATRYFRFHPALASGPSLDDLTLQAADPSRRECEGTTVVPTADGVRVLASDRRRRSYPVLDADLRQVGALDAAYPDNIPWPTLVDLGANAALLVGFDGRGHGGGLVGYGSHGDVVVQRSISR